MSYKNPFLANLRDVKDEGLMNERRTVNAVNLMSQVPLTLDKLMKEEEARKQKLKQQDFENSQEVRQADRLDGELDLRKDSEKRVSKNADRSFFSNRGGDLITNTVMGLLGTVGEGKNPNQEIPVEKPDMLKGSIADSSALGPESQKVFGTQNTSSVDMVKGSIADTSAMGDATKKVFGVADAPITPPVTQETPQQPQSPIEEIKMSVFSKRPEIKTIFDEAISRLNQYPEFKDNYREEDVLGEIVKQFNERETDNFKNQLSTSRLNIDNQLKMARIQRLQTPKSPSLKGEKEWPVSLTQPERADLRRYSMSIIRLDKLADSISKGTLQPGFFTGVGNRVRNAIKLRNSNDAGELATMQREINAVIKDIAGAQVTPNELERITRGMPDTFDDKETLTVFIDLLREEAALNHNNLIEFADLGKRSPVPIRDRIPTLDSKGKPISKEEPKKDKLDSILDKMGF